LKNFRIDVFLAFFFPADFIGVVFFEVVGVETKGVSWVCRGARGREGVGRVMVGAGCVVFCFFAEGGEEVRSMGGEEEDEEDGECPRTVEGG
jgi:hypothetical protein